MALSLITTMEAIKHYRITVLSDFECLCTSRIYFKILGETVKRQGFMEEGLLIPVLVSESSKHQSLVGFGVVVT